MTYAQCPKCHARLRVPDSRQSLHVRCPGCGHAFQTRPGAREEAAPGSFATGGRRPLVKVLLIAWAVVAIGGAVGVTYLLATDTAPTTTPALDEPSPGTMSPVEGTTPLAGIGEPEGEPDMPGYVIPPPPGDGIDETQYDKKPKTPKKPRKGGRRKGRGKSKPEKKSSEGGLKKTDISASRN